MRVPAKAVSSMPANARTSGAEGGVLIGPSRAGWAMMWHPFGVRFTTGSFREVRGNVGAWPVDRNSPRRMIRLDGARRVLIVFRASWAIVVHDREAGENPARPRHCNRGRTPQEEPLGIREGCG